MARYDISEVVRRQLEELWRTHGNSYLPPRKPTQRRQHASESSFGVPVRNDSGETIPAYGVMRLTGTVEVDGELYWTVAKPNTTFQRFVLVNTEDEIGYSGSSQYGAGLFLDYASRVLYDSADGTPTYDQEWGIKNGQWKLSKNRSGFRLWGSVDTDDHSMIAVQREVTEVIGKFDATASSGSVSVSVWCGLGGAEVDSGMDITAWIKTAVTSAKWASAGWRNGSWYAAPLECS